MSPVARRYRIVVFSVCLLLACSAAAYGQDTVRVPGVIVQEGGGPQGGLIAELCDPLGDKVVSRAVVVPAGEFAFEAVTPGQYRLRIAAWGGEILAQRVVSAGSDGTPVEIRLERLGQTAPATVSLAQLQHHVPSRAARELGREARAFAEGDIQGAIAHLRRALEIDPSFMEAHNNLGVRYMALNRFEDAAAEFRRAIELDPAADKAFANLAGALLLLGRDEEAEVAARRAVALAPAYFQGHDLLARVLVAEGKSRDEAAREFTRATRLRR